MKQVRAIIKSYMVPNVIKALNDHTNFPDVVISSVVVFGQPGEMNTNIKIFHEYLGYAKKVKLEFLIPDDQLDLVIDLINSNAYTGNLGDGQIFVSTVDEVMKIQIEEKK